MSGACPPASDLGMAEGLLQAVDCNVRTLVHDSFRALVGPDTWFAAALTGLLTIYIALIGYQLILGRGGLRVTDLPASVIKIGVITAFLTSWAAYQSAAYSLLFEGPGQIIGTLLSVLPGQQGTWSGDVMDSVEAAFSRLSASATAYGAMASPNANLLQGGPMLGAGLLWLSAILILLLTLGLLLAAKIVLAFLLAIGPLFIGFMLFDATRGLFDGWIRATVAFALVPVAVTVLGAVMLLIMEPYLAVVSDNAALRLFDMSPVVLISLILLVFLLVMIFALISISVIGGGFRTERGRPPGAVPYVPGPAWFTGPRSGARPSPGQVAQEVGLATETARWSYRETALERPSDTASHLRSPTPLTERLGQAYPRIGRLSATRDGA